MAGRIRTIKPELLEDEKASALSDAAWRLFVSSWLLADDHGRFRAGARYLAAQVWQDTGRTKQAAEALEELAQSGRVRVYQVGGETYAEIPTWARHQRVDNAGKERIPPPPQVSASDYKHLETVSRRLAETRGEPPPSAATRVCAPPPSPTSDPDLRPPSTSVAPAGTHAREGEPVEPPAQAQASASPVPVAAGAAPPKLDPAALGGDGQDLLALARDLADEGNGLGTSVLERAAKGHRPTPGQLKTLREIRAERAAAPARASPGRRHPVQQEPKGGRLYESPEW